MSIKAVQQLGFGVLPHANKADLDAFVQQGGGLLVTGGAQCTSIRRALRRAGPCAAGKAAPPRPPEGTCLVLIVDNRRRWKARRWSWRASRDRRHRNIRPVDLVGVHFRQLVSMGGPYPEGGGQVADQASDRGITPDGVRRLRPR
jgi:hypothetical protein